jgi:hypothetical protein
MFRSFRILAPIAINKLNFQPCSKFKPFCKFTTAACTPTNDIIKNITCMNTLKIYLNKYQNDNHFHTEYFTIMETIATRETRYDLLLFKHLINITDESLLLKLDFQKFVKTIVFMLKNNKLHELELLISRLKTLNYMNVDVESYLTNNPQYKHIKYLFDHDVVKYYNDSMLMNSRINSSYNEPSKDVMEKLVELSIIYRNYVFLSDCLTNCHTRNIKLTNNVLKILVIELIKDNTEFSPSNTTDITVAFRRIFISPYFSDIDINEVIGILNTLDDKEKTKAEVLLPTIKECCKNILTRKVNNVAIQINDGVNTMKKVAPIFLKMYNNSRK